MLSSCYVHDSQASLYSLLQAVNEISSRGNNRDGDINVFVQRRYCASYLLNLAFHMSLSFYKLSQLLLSQEFRFP